MTDSRAELVPAAESVSASEQRDSRLAREVAKSRGRSSRRREPVLEVLDGRILLSLVHPELPGSGTAQIQPLTRTQALLRTPLPPMPVFLSLPLSQQGGNILSQTHVTLYHRIFIANETFLAHTGIEYLERYTEASLSIGATTAGTAADTSEAVQAFLQQLVSQVEVHGGSTTEFIEPADGNGGGVHAPALSGVIEGELYAAKSNHLSFAMAYETPDDFLFYQQFLLKAIRVARPLSASSFSLLDTVNEFEHHFQVSGAVTGTQLV